MSHAAVIAAQEKLLRAALRILSAEREEPHSHYDDELTYAHEQLALAARDLYEATEASDRKPVGWERTNPADLAEGDWVTLTLRKARLFSDVYVDFQNGGRYTVKVGHDVLIDDIPIVLTDDVTVVRVAEPMVAPVAKGADQ